LIRSQGLQEADARDACQQVLLAVAQDVKDWKPDGEEASFRRWLFRIARLRVLKLLSRKSREPLVAGGSAARDLLNAQPDTAERIEDRFEHELRQQVLFQAAAQVKHEFKDSTWQAFWKTCIEQRPVAEVAAELRQSAGNVYVARSRIVARL